MTVDVGDRPRPRARQRAAGLREPHRLGAGGHVPLPPAPVRRRRRLRRVGRPRARAGRDPREAAGPGDLPRADHAAHRPRPAAAGRGGRGRRAGVAALRRAPRSPRACRRSPPGRRSASSCSSSRRLPLVVGPRRVPAGAAAARGRARRWPGTWRSACGSKTRPRSPTPAALPLATRDGAARLRRQRRAARPRPRRALRARADGAPSLRLSAFRNPKGALPDGLALAPWERPSEIPPETDGFFLLELLPPSAPRRGRRPRPAARRPCRLAIVFDTSLSHRWSGLEAAYAQLVRVLDSLTPKDRFALVAFDTPAGAALAGGAGHAGAPRAGADGAARAGARAGKRRRVGRSPRRRAPPARTGRVLLLTRRAAPGQLGGARRGARARAAVHVADRRGDARVVRDRVVAAARAGRLGNRDRASSSGGSLAPARAEAGSRQRGAAVHASRAASRSCATSTRCWRSRPRPAASSGWIGRYAVAAAVAALGARLAARPRRPRGARRAAAREGARCPRPAPALGARAGRPPARGGSRRRARSASGSTR